MRSEMQKRTFASQFRADEQGGKKRIEGYFAVFDDIYEMMPGVTESVSKNAFDGQTERDVRALIDHESRLVLGRTTAGTLSLKVDERGLWGSIEINENDTDAMNVYARVARGDVNQCSFGFEILDEERTIDEAAGNVHYTIKSVRLWEVSVVTFPAYEATGVSARAKDLKEIKRSRIEKWRQMWKERLKNGA